MAAVKLNKKVPAFDLPATGDKNIKLSTLKGKKVIIYFYPRDSTPGCTTEGQDFRDNHNKFKRAGAVVLGVSRDSIKSHENLQNNHWESELQYYQYALNYFRADDRSGNEVQWQ